jgi:hypothetical protein
MWMAEVTPAGLVMWMADISAALGIASARVAATAQVVMAMTIAAHRAERNRTTAAVLELWCWLVTDLFIGFLLLDLLARPCLRDYARVGPAPDRVMTRR